MRYSVAFAGKCDCGPQSRPVTLDACPHLRALPGETHLATPNYSYEKRQRELAKKRKAEEKRQRKLSGKPDEPGSADEPQAEGDAPADPAAPAEPQT